MLLVVVAVISLGVAVWFLFYSLHEQKNQDDSGIWEIGITFSIIAILGIIGGIGGGGFGSQYAASIYLPLQLEALNATIEQQAEYITGIDATIGQGLEGMEIKREIQQTIRDRNMLLAQIEYRQVSPWYLFKPKVAG